MLRAIVRSQAGAVTNISFYDSPANELIARRGALPRCLTPLLMSDNDEAVLEAARAFGNFSRHQEVR
eukprot:7670766-Pyramimonas_sp.AAC.1